LIKAGIHFTTYRSGRLLLNEVKYSSERTLQMNTGKVFELFEGSISDINDRAKLIVGGFSLSKI